MAIAFRAASPRGNNVAEAIADVPSGIQDNDVLVATIVVNGSTITGPPSGWTLIADVTAITNPKFYMYYHVVTDAASEPSTYTWTLSATADNGCIIAAYSGVDNSNPLDVATASEASDGGTPTELLVGSVTTQTDNAWLIAGWGVNSSSVTITEPGTMTERAEVTTAKVENQCDEPQASAGASGSRTATFSGGRACCAIMTALKPSGDAPQTARPDGDVSLDGWTDEGNGTTNIYQSIDEETASDSDFVRSPESPTSDVYEFTLENLSDPQVNTGHIVRYRYHKNTAAGDQVNLTVGLYQGATLIASQTHNDIPDGVTAGSFTLSGAEADNITNYDDLRIRLTANTP